MAISASAVGTPKIQGAQRRTVTDIALDSSYPTGGYAVTPANLGLNSVEHAIAKIKTPAASSITEVFFDTANSKLKLNAPTAEVANATDVSAGVVRVTAWGT